ncbi:DUF3060 domain-containing protein, partial [Nocardia alni]|uniref:DUF3060 domain-containing protein n=1 Tax=Nocardia alni TaxID=2815723 RepID=UPI001C211F94
GNSMGLVEPQNSEQRIADLERQLAEARRIAELQQQLASAKDEVLQQESRDGGIGGGDAVPSYRGAASASVGAHSVDAVPRDDRLAEAPRKVPAGFVAAEMFPFRWWYVWILFMVAVAPIALWIYVPAAFTVVAVLTLVVIYGFQFYAVRTRMALLKWGEVAAVAETEILSRGSYYSGTTWYNAPLPVAHGWQVTRPLYSGPSTRTRIRYTLAGHQGELVVSGREYIDGVILADSRNPLRALCVTSFAYDLDRDGAGDWVGRIRPRLKIGMAVWLFIVIVWLAFAAAIPTGVTGHVATSVGTVTIKPGGTARVSGNSRTKTVNCGNGYLSVSGNSNSVTVRGHCAGLTVSGNSNIVTVDAADSITVSGIGVKVTYHSGTPRIENSGISNSVARG